jgi:tetratricopeptide (TPR) repeat protein
MIEVKGKVKTILVRFLLQVVAVVLVTGLLEGGARAGGQDKPIDSISDAPRRARLVLFHAYEARREGDYEKSSKILLDYLERNLENDHFLVRFHLGNSMARSHSPEDQLEQYKKCVELEPRYAKGWMNLGEVAYNVGEYALAAEALTNGFRMSEEKKAQVLYYAAAAYVMAEQSKKAIPSLEELISGAWGEPKMDWYRALLSAALQTGDTASGKRAVDQMLAQFGSDPAAWTLACQYHAGAADYRQSAVALAAKGYLIPLSREEQIQLGDLYSAIDVPALASREYEAAMAENATAKELERLASVHLAAHELDAALRTIERSLDMEPGAKLWSLYGDLNFMEKKYDAAYRAYEKSADIDPESGRAYLMMAFCAMELGDKESAKARLQAAAAYPDQETKAREILSKLDDYMP